jgi:diguanylate cyclase (GGDEF)-like protein
MTTDIHIAAREGAFHRYVEESVARRTAELAALLGAVRAQAEADHRAATTDTLTGLLNRAGLTETWEQVNPSGLILLDLNGFKDVNDTYYHAAGDVVLQVIGARLAELDAVTARLGGDEFVLIARDGTDAHNLATQAYKAINQPVTLPCGTVVSVSAAIGIRVLDDPTGLGEALKDADEAMYLAKEYKGTDRPTIAVWTAPVQARTVLAGKVVRLRDQPNPISAPFVHAVFPVITRPAAAPKVEPVTVCVCGRPLGYVARVNLSKHGGWLRQVPVHAEAGGCRNPEAATCAHVGCHADHSPDTTCSAEKDWCCGRCGCLDDYDGPADYDYDYDLDVE